MDEKCSDAAVEAENSGAAASWSRSGRRSCGQGQLGELVRAQLHRPEGWADLVLPGEACLLEETLQLLELVFRLPAKVYEAAPAPLLSLISVRMVPSRMMSARATFDRRHAS